MTEQTPTVAEFEAAMAADWNTYHAYYETTEEAEMTTDLAKYKTVEAALAHAKRVTDLFNEMQSNCY